MDRKLLALILVPITILMIIIPAQNIPRVWAPPLTGIVCVAQTTDTKCPITTPVFNGPVTTPRTLLRVPIMVNNTDIFNTFDITLKVGDATKLKPYDADLTGSFVPISTVLAKCVGGVLIQGNTCLSATDTPDTIHLAVVASVLLPSGSTGLLFTAVFNITGTTAAGGISLGYQTGCTITSVSGTSVCVAFANGTTQPTPETIQNGGFDNSNTAALPYATMTSAKTSLGQFLLGLAASTTDVFTLTSVNHFNLTTTPTVTLASSVTGRTPRPTATLSTSFIDFSTPPPPATTATSTLTASVAANNPAGNYNVTVTGIYSTQDPTTFITSSLEAITILRLSIVDFSISASPNPLAAPAGTGTTLQTTITISPASFTGLVKLGVQTPTLPTGVAASYSPPTITSPTTSTLTVTTTASTPVGAYSITLTSNSTLNGVTKSHVSTLTLQIQDFTISPSPSTVSVAPATAGTSTITISPSSGFTGIVTLTSSIQPNTGLTCTLTPSTITGSGTSTLSCQGSLGTYTVTVTGTSALLVHTVTVTFNVGITHSVTIDSVSVSPQGSVTVGMVVTLTVQVDNKGSAQETVVVNVLANNITVATAQNVMVPANTVKPVTITWTTTATGTYAMSANVILPAGETNSLTNSSSVGNYTVQPASTSPLSDPTTQLAIIVVAIAAAAIGGFVLTRRRKTTPASI